MLSPLGSLAVDKRSTMATPRGATGWLIAVHAKEDGRDVATVEVIAVCICKAYKQAHAVAGQFLSRVCLEERRHERRVWSWLCRSPAW